jgi:hypothetical protein
MRSEPVMGADWWVVVHYGEPAPGGGSAVPFDDGVERLDVVGFDGYREALAAFASVAPGHVHLGALADSPVPSLARGVLSASLVDFAGRVILGGVDSCAVGGLEFPSFVMQGGSFAAGRYEARFDEDLISCDMRLVGAASLPTYAVGAHA